MKANIKSVAYYVVISYNHSKYCESTLWRYFQL